MKTRRPGYNYGYGYYAPPVAVPTRQLMREPGFLSEAQKATLGPLRLKLVQQVEDRRRFDMAMLTAAQVSAKGLYRDSATLVEDPRKPLRANPAMTFNVPAEVAICSRRKERREVLLAKGKGGGAHRKPRRNPWSDVKC